MRGMEMTADELLRISLLDQRRRGLQERSIECRQAKIKTFIRWMAAIGVSPLEATQEDVERFLDARPIGPRTRYAWLSHLHSFYDMLARADVTDIDPTAKILRPKLPRLLPRPAASADLDRALAAASPKHRCWVVLAAFEGMRCQEIAGLKVEDVFAKKGKVAVTKGKGGKQRMLPLHPDVLAALKVLPMPRSGYVFVRPRGGPYPPAVLSAQFNRFLKEAITDRHVTAHQLRHWFGTEFYRQTHDLRLTAEVMGHSDTSTTAVYTRVDVSDAAGPLMALSFDKQEETP